MCELNVVVDKATEMTSYSQHLDSTEQEFTLQTQFGDIRVSVVGDPHHDPIITYHDIGLNRHIFLENSKNYFFE
jgi:hypothetical protein